MLPVPDVLTIPEVAAVLRLSPERVRAAIRRGRLPSIQLVPRGKHRIRRTDLEHFMQAPAQRAGGASR
jgi:excisionase family DNA binding protein